MRYIWRNGKVVEADKASLRPWVTGVISDNMAETLHHGTGRIHTSKAKFRADTKAIGAVEIGNEVQRPRAPVKLDRGKRRDDIRKAVYMLKNGYKLPRFASDN